MRSIPTFAALALVASVTVPRYAAHMNASAGADVDGGALGDAGPSARRRIRVRSSSRPTETDISRSKAVSTAGAWNSWSIPAPR